jgi:hypothetical protein
MRGESGRDRKFKRLPSNQAQTATQLANIHQLAI